MRDKKICVVGLGGVGGYISGMLAHHLENVYFYVRGSRLQSIKKNGLQFFSNSKGDFKAYPKLASNFATEIGVMDYVFLCVKTYSLEQVCAEIMPIIDENTVVLPLLNGVGNALKIKNLLKKGRILDGLIYIISYTDENFAVHHSSPSGNIHFGSINNYAVDNIVLTKLKDIFEFSNITCRIEEDIEAASWRKYILNCSFNIITAFYQATIGEIKKNELAVSQMRALLFEGCLVARKLSVKISDKLEDELYNHLLFKQADDSTSSLKRDFDCGRENELETFSGHMLKMGTELGLKLSMTEFFYRELSKRKSF